MTSPSASGDPTTRTAATSRLETHLLFILLDSNLPTGGFVSSSGLESYAKHGFLSPFPSYAAGAPTSTHKSHVSESIGHRGPSRGPSLKPGGMALAITRFAEAEVENYARSTAPFAFDAWRVVDKALRGGGAERCSSCNRSRSKGKQRAQPESEVMSGSEVEVQTVLEAILALDAQQEACLLSHVSRRSSKAQGVAMLTLYSRGLSRPEGFDLDSDLQNGDEGESLASFKREEMAKELVEGYKRWIRKGSAPGHLAVCWGVMTAALGLSIDRALHLHLFLHARSLLSSAVRLNLIGPYLSSQLLLFPFEGIIEKHLDDPGSTGVIQGCKCKEQVDEKADSADDFWSWAEEAENGPATTWPLGEVLMARHDLQHSRIFNS